MVVSWILDGAYRDLALVDVIYDVRSMLSSSSFLEVCCVSRDSNGLADVLAKRGAALTGEDVYWFV